MKQRDNTGEALMDEGLEIAMAPAPDSKILVMNGTAT
jgi:hypothetical protein